jgi:V/A-type H+-transporting ATPase subunit E
MTQKKTPSDAVVYDERKKLSELQSVILQKGNLERERILEEARAEAEKWTDEQTARLDAMVNIIKADAAKRSAEMTSRQLIEAESARDKGRLRLENELVQRALALFQDALIAFDKRPDYDAILTGAAAEACRRLPEGQKEGQKVEIRLRREDTFHGEAVTDALRQRFPNLDIAFDETPAPIIGGVLLHSREEKWRVVADWKSKVDEMADMLAKAVLAEL